eukprot:5181689-Pleurochrysis_carterae.AAC.1
MSTRSSPPEVVQRTMYIRGDRELSAEQAMHEKFVLSHPEARRLPEICLVSLLTIVPNRTSPHPRTTHPPGFSPTHRPRTTTFRCIS